MLLTKVEPEVGQILKYKYSDKRIRTMEPPDILKETAELLLRIHVITGWKLPDDQQYIKILTEELLKKLTEDYSEMNFQEITYAFRKNIGKKDWGKNMNLDLIDSVLSEYLADRSKASMEEERIKSKPTVQKVYSEEELDNIQRWDIECFYQRCRVGKIPTGIPDYFLNILIKDGYMAEGSDDVSLFFSEKLNSGVIALYTKS